MGGEFEKRRKDSNFQDIQADIYGQFENTFMMYLPRLCEHCLNPTCVASCPSGAIYKREEDGIVLIDQDKCRGWRMCVSGCPYKKIYFNWQSGKSEKCTFCYPRIEAEESAARIEANARSHAEHEMRAAWMSAEEARAMESVAARWWRFEGGRKAVEEIERRERREREKREHKENKSDVRDFFCTIQSPKHIQ